MEVTVPVIKQMKCRKQTRLAVNQIIMIKNKKRIEKSIMVYNCIR